MHTIKKPYNIPFKLATTSFIYPDRIVPNVKRLGSVFDEIELLIFESRPFIPKFKDNNCKKVNSQICSYKTISRQTTVINPIDLIDVLPSKDEIRELVNLSHSLDLTYNVHLPVDVSLTDASKTERIKAVDTIKRVLELCVPLNPTTHTLHLEFNYRKTDKHNKSDNYNKADNRLFDSDLSYLESDDNLKIWREIARESLENLSLSLADPSIISIETLDYPFEYIADIVDEYGFSICIDAGHLIRYGYNYYNHIDVDSIDGWNVKAQFDITTLFNRYRDKIPLVHLHGVDFSSFTSSAAGLDSTRFLPKDHQSLDKTPPSMLAPTMNLLKEFTGVVSLEVFNYKNLSDSLTLLDNFFMKLPQYNKNKGIIK